MRNYSNISSLFSGMNNSSYMYGGSSSGFNLSDYSLIKSGSYKKLMKAYYNQDSKLSKTDKSNTIVNNVNKVTEAVDKTGLTKMKAESDGLKKSAQALNSSEMWSADTDKTKVTDAVKSFASNYNKVLDQASKVNTSGVSNNTKWMTSMTSTMSKALEKIGVKVGADSKLTVDEETLNKADTNSIKSLFNGDYSYGGQIATKANAIANSVSSLGTYNSNAAYNNSLLSMFSVGI